MSEVKRGSVVQIIDEAHHWFPCLLVVTEVKSFGVQACLFTPNNNSGDVGQAYIRLKKEEYCYTGDSAVIPE